MPERGIGQIEIIEGCRTCEEGIDEGDGLGCQIFLNEKEDTDFCILYKDSDSALHYFRILPRAPKGIFCHKLQKLKRDRPVLKRELGKMRRLEEFL